jgi:GAF domain-containing protein
MSPTEREYMNRLCLRIHNESDPIVLAELIVELDDFLRDWEDRRSHLWSNPPAKPTSGERNPYLQFRGRRWLRDLLGASIAATDADFGDVQLFDSRYGVLRIVANEGFETDFLDYFEIVDCGEHCSCGAAMKQGSRIVVGDVANNPVFSGGSREMLLHSDVRSVQSTPLFDMSGRFLGMVSTHYRRVDGPEPGMWAQADQIAANFTWKAQEVSG